MRIHDGYSIPVWFNGEYRPELSLELRNAPDGLIHATFDAFSIPILTRTVLRPEQWRQVVQGFKSGTLATRFGHLNVESDGDTVRFDYVGDKPELNHVFQFRAADLLELLDFLDAEKGRS